MHDIEYAPVKWIFKAETYQIIQREKMYLADRDENIVENLEDLSTDMQNRAKALFKTQDRVYVMLIHIEEYSLRGSGYVIQKPLHPLQILILISSYRFSIIISSSFSIN